jgi:hypothetical protein
MAVGDFPVNGKIAVVTGGGSGISSNSPSLITNMQSIKLTG